MVLVGEVRSFHREGLEAGGADHGAPGVRELYHPAYCAAFLLDPEGHNIEAVCFEPPSAPQQCAVRRGQRE